MMPEEAFFCKFKNKDCLLPLQTSLEIKIIPSHEKLISLQGSNFQEYNWKLFYSVHRRTK